MLRKGGSNWVDGDRFFDRAVELDALEERVREGTHPLLTAQRRMGKTSLVRELLRRLAESGEFDTVFVDLEAAMDPADAVAEIGVQARPLGGAWDRIKGSFANVLREAGDRFEELAVADMRVRLRAGIDAGNWPQRGDAIFSALASDDKPVVLAVDELPILVSRLLKDGTGIVTTQGRQSADEFLSWLRRNGQTHRRQVTMLLSGSVGLEPLLEQAGLSAHANIYSAYDLRPWSEDTAAACLAELAGTYGIGLPPEVGEDMCRRLRCCIPHHVQMFFDKLHEHLRHEGRRNATTDDGERVYLHEMLSVRGQADLQHYEGRFQTVLGKSGYPVALEILSATAVEGRLERDTLELYPVHFAAQEEVGAPSVEGVLHVLEHDGYLEREGGGYRFVSGLLEDWWRGRYGANFEPAIERERGMGR